MRAERLLWRDKAEFPLENPRLVPHGGRILRLVMKLLIALLALTFFVPVFAGAQQYDNIAPTWKCHHKKNKKGACRRFPNLARKLNLCPTDPEIIGTIEWCRREFTKTELDDCGNPVTYDALEVTYRYVYCNGAWGHCFTRTYRVSPEIVVPPVLAKGVVSK